MTAAEVAERRRRSYCELVEGGVGAGGDGGAGWRLGRTPRTPVELGEWSMELERAESATTVLLLVGEDDWAAAMTRWTKGLN